MPYRIKTHDAWGSTPVGDFPSLEAARQAFSSLCQDPWYRQDGTVKGLELLEIQADSQGQRLDWFAFA
jgi:hypothetical protein